MTERVNRKFGGVILGTIVSVLCLVLLSGCAQKKQTGVWASVKARANASGSEKDALWQELGTLSPEDLLVCGEEYFQTEEQEQWADAMIADTILSYYSAKTSPGATATAIARILRTSENSRWLEESVMWLENKDHFVDVPEEAMRQIGDAICASIRGETKQSIAGRESALHAALEDTLILSLPEDSSQAVQDACRDLLAEGSRIAGSERMREFAARYLRDAKEFEDDKDEWDQHASELRAQRKKAQDGE